MTGIRGIWLALGVMAMGCTTMDKNDSAELKSCGTEGGRKILVAYGTRAGSTREVAEFIGNELCQQGLRVDVRNVEQVDAVSGYQGVVVGSAIRMGSWVSEAKNFITEHKAELTQVPVAYFSVCMTLKEDTPEKRKEVSVYTDSVRAIVAPKTEAFFAGKGDYSKLSLFPWLAAKMVKMPEGDFRDWNKIRDWTREVRAQL